MNRMQTLYAIDKVAAGIFADISKVRKIGKESDLVYQAQMDNLADKMMDIVQKLSAITIEIDPRINDEDILTDKEIYAEVRKAITSDRQYAADSIMYWQSHGEDLKHIATMLETEIVVLVDLIDEFTEG